ncbi:amidase [Mycobacterium sp. LTG2003]
MGKSTTCDSATTLFPTLTNQLYQLASGAITSDELVRRSLHAITASQSTLNAFRVVLTEQAMADAARADRDRAAGKQLPLLGIPIAVKDDIDIAGIPTRYGTNGNARVATADAEVVRRLRAAGAVIVGKTNTCELGQWPFTSGPGFGHTRNPWSSKHSPGGSSGGSAAAVAAGLVAAAIGSDSAGNVRIPAAWTHLVGIKPQRGRISTWPLPEAFNGITVNGVLARTVTDAALVLDAASGNADGDLHKPPPIQAADYVGRAPGPLRVAMSTKLPFTGFRAKLHPDIRAAVQTVADQLGQLGHTVVAKDPKYSVRMSWDFLSRSTAGLLDWSYRLGDIEYDDRTVANMRIGRLLSENVLRKARAHEAHVQRRMGWIFNLVDVVIAPTTAQPPPLTHDFDRLGWYATERRAIQACPMTWPWNLLGWPSISVPAGLTSEGLPIGIQLMGPANSEPMLISLAAELEAITGWAAKQPTVWWNTPDSHRVQKVNGETPEDYDVSQAVAAVNALRQPPGRLAMANENE